MEKLSLSYIDNKLTRCLTFGVKKHDSFVLYVAYTVVNVKQCFTQSVSKSCLGSTWLKC